MITDSDRLNNIGGQALNRWMDRPFSEFLSGNGPFSQSMRQSPELLVGRTMYVSAQSLDFLDLVKNHSFPNQKLR
jgi:hypothetical protein